MPRFLPDFVVYAFAIGSTLWFAPNDSVAQDQLARLRLKNGDFVDGVLAPSAGEGIFSWQSPIFLTPLAIDTRRIGSIDFPDAKEIAVSEDPFRFLLGDGSRLCGELEKLDEKEVVIASRILGKIQFDRQSLRQMERRDRSSRILYEGPRSLEEWRSEAPQSWSFHRGAIQSVAHHSSIRCELKMPAICFVELRIAWDAKPDFVVSLGVEKGTTKEPMAAARLEVWDGQLTVVRESGKNADIAILSKLPATEGSIDLTVYLNQEDGLVSVFSPSGEMLVKLSVPFEQPMPLSDVLVSNGGSQIRVEKLDLYQWDGTLPDPNAKSGEFVALESGTLLREPIVSFDKAAGTLRTVEEKTEPIPLVSVQRIVFAKPGTEGEGQSEKTPITQVVQKAENGPIDPDTINVRLRDGSRLVGRWLGLNGNHDLELFVPELNTKVTIAKKQLATILGAKSTELASEAKGKSGRLIANGVTLNGEIVGNSNHDAAAVLGWKPTVCQEPSAINLQASGAIDYSASKTASKPPAANARQLRMQGGQLALDRQKLLIEQLRLLGQGVVPDLKAQQRVDFDGALRNRAEREADLAELFNSKYGLRQSIGPRTQLGLLMRSGDRIDGDVVAIDERGVTFNSTATVTKFVTHDKIQSIVMSHTSKPLDLSTEKLDRLLTVPRMSKSDPPTHLLIAMNGDHLRGRLLKLDADTATIEVRLEPVELPRKAIAQIVWLHDRNWDVAPKKAAGSGQESAESSPEIEPPLVHAVLTNGDSLTFSPKSVSAGRLSGTSSLLGDCSVPLGDLSQLLFGPDTAMRALELQQETWKLSLARNPKVLDADLAEQNGELLPSQRSPLVGKPAPNFTLENLSEKMVQLSKRKGRVVVLDFWASWCGPCIATMPEVARVVAEHGNDSVDLLGVNLQETPERIHSALNRLGLALETVLDTEGEVAELYGAQAIPQTVIIDREGIVRHIFVGGGTKFVKQFQTALTEVIQMP